MNKMRKILFVLLVVIMCCGLVWSFFTPGTDAADKLIASAVLSDSVDQTEVLKVDSLLLRNTGNLDRDIIDTSASDTLTMEKIDSLSGVDRIPANSVPEPATMFLLGAGLVGLAGLSRKTILKKA